MQKNMEKRKMSREEFERYWWAMLDMVDIDEFPKSKNALADTFEQTKWIPVSEKLLPKNKPVIVSVLEHEWISDYDSAWVPEEEKIYHPERFYTTIGFYKDDEWIFLEVYGDNDCEGTMIKAKKPQDITIAYPCEEVIAWMPLPEPYTDKKSL